MKIEQYLHVQDNNSLKPGNADRGFKIGPLIDMLIAEERLCFYSACSLFARIRSRPFTSGPEDQKCSSEKSLEFVPEDHRPWPKQA